MNVAYHFKWSIQCALKNAGAGGYVERDFFAIQLRKIGGVCTKRAFQILGLSTGIFFTTLYTKRGPTIIPFLTTHFCFFTTFDAINNKLNRMHYAV
jgi:hypothetical protein